MLTVGDDASDSTRRLRSNNPPRGSEHAAPQHTSQSVTRARRYCGHLLPTTRMTRSRLLITVLPAIHFDLAVGS
jgi:hypothetical protein